MERCLYSPNQAEQDRLLAEQTAIALAESRWEQSEVLRKQQNAANQGSSSGAIPVPTTPRAAPADIKKINFAKNGFEGLGLPDKATIKAQAATRTDTTHKNNDCLKHTETALNKTAERARKRAEREAEALADERAEQEELANQYESGIVG